MSVILSFDELYLAWVGFSRMKNAEIWFYEECKGDYVCPLRQTQDCVPRLHYRLLAALPFCLHPLPSLISTCFNLSFGTWKVLKARVYSLQTRDGFHDLEPNRACFHNHCCGEFLLHPTGARLENQSNIISSTS